MRDEFGFKPLSTCSSKMNCIIELLMGFFSCLDDDEAKNLMGEIHEGVCGAHQSAFKMKWMIRRNGYYWPTILEDCFKYFKGCQGCQKFGNVQRAPASPMNPIIKPWPFRGWAIDFIG